MILADANLTVALVAAGAAILSAAGSIAVSVVSWRLGVRRFAHEREQADRDDARDSLAAAALALGRTKTLMRFAYGRFRRPLEQLGKEWPSDAPDWFTRLEDAAEDLEKVVAVLRIRFAADDPVVTELMSCLHDLRSLVAVYKKAWGSLFGTTYNRDELADGEEGAKLNASFDEHSESFLLAARRLVGSSLA